MMLKIVKVASGILGVVFWFTSFFVWRFYDAHRPTTYTPGTGRSFPLETHGSIIYLTASEGHLLCGLMAAGVGFFLLCAVCYFFGGRSANARGS